MTVTLPPFTLTNLPTYWDLAYGDPKAEWYNWDAPYLPRRIPTKTAFVTEANPYLDPNFFRLIAVDNTPVGMVSAHYEDGDLKQWLDMGIMIQSPKLWRHGIGKAALSQWLDFLWQTIDLPHLGITTWSGNQRMMGLAESVGMHQEAVVRQVRYWQGHYWDSVKYGLLRSEWGQAKSKKN